jgi:CheY-specific phosphatase CheX
VNADQRRVVSGAFCSVLERMAFMFAEPMHTPSEPEPCSDSCTIVSMRFSGVLTGSLELALPQKVCTEIAANMLGEEPQDADAQDKQMDATRELLNVTCGQVLTDLAGERPMFELTVPESAPLSPERRTVLLGDQNSIVFSIDGNLVLLRMALEAAR